jgi:hypothetical protein
MRQGRTAGSGRAGSAPTPAGRSLSVAALHSRQPNDHRALCPRQTCSAPSGDTPHWPDHRKRTTVRSLHHDRLRRSVGRHRTNGKAAPPRPPCLAPADPLVSTASPAPTALPAPARCDRPGRLAPSRPIPPVPHAPAPPRRKNGNARRPSRSRAADALAPPGRQRLGQARHPRRAQAPAGCPRPRRPGGYSQARLPAAAAGAGRAPPVTAAAPPMSF